MALLVGIVLTLVSISLCVRQITKNKGMSTAANMTYFDTRDEWLCEVDDLPPPLPADPDGVKPSKKDEEPFVANTNVVYDVVQNKWSTDTSRYATKPR